jgi:ABC-2 type transport system permease protein
MTTDTSSTGTSTTGTAGRTDDGAVAPALRDAISMRERPERPTGLSASFTFGWRAMLRIKHVPEQLFDVTAFPIMMTLMFTYLFGGALEGSVSQYLQFVLPGIMVMSVVTITMYTGVALNTDIEKGVFNRFRSLPIWRPSVLVGALLGDAVRYTIASTVILTVGLILGFRPDGGPVGVLLGMALILVFCFSVSWIWVLLALYVRTPQSVMSISMMFIFPLTFISNVFVDPSTMPGWLQAFVDVNPITLLVNAVRALMQGNPAGSDVMWVLVSCVALVAVFGTLTMRRFNRHS